MPEFEDKFYNVGDVDFLEHGMLAKQIGDTQFEFILCTPISGRSEDAYMAGMATVDISDSWISHDDIKRFIGDSNCTDLRLAIGCLDYYGWEEFGLKFDRNETMTKTEVLEYVLSPMETQIDLIDLNQIRDALARIHNLDISGAYLDVDSLEIPTKQFTVPQFVPIEVVENIKLACEATMDFVGDTLGEKIRECSHNMVPIQAEDIYSHMKFITPYVEAYHDKYGPVANENANKSLDLMRLVQAGWSEMYQNMLEANLPAIVYNHLAEIINSQGYDFWGPAHEVGLNYDKVLNELEYFSQHVDIGLSVDECEKGATINSMSYTAGIVLPSQEGLTLG